MKFVLQSLVLLLCLLFGRGAQAQAPSYTMTHETVTDTPANHFENYWLLANAPLLTESGRTRLQRGQVRLSLRAMSNPARYGLIDPTAATHVVTAAKLLCENRETGSLQLRCRMPDEPHGRRVRLTESQCRGAPDLYTLVPEGCQRPHVMTVEGREVQLSRITRIADPAPPPDEPEPAAEPQPVVAANPLPDSAVGGLQRELSAEREAAREHRTEARALSRQLDRAYIGLILLTLCIAAAGLFAWRAKDKAKTSPEFARNLLQQVALLQEIIEKVGGSTEGSGAFRMHPDLANHVVHLGHALVFVRDAFIKEHKEKVRLAEEAACLRREREARTPSIVIDPKQVDPTHVAAEIEARLRTEFEAERQRLLAAQAIERERLQDSIDTLRVELRSANARRSAKSEPPATPSEPDPLQGPPLVDVITDVIEQTVAGDRRRGPAAAATSARNTQLGIGKPPGEPYHRKTLQPPAPADEPSSPPAPTGSPPPSSPSPGDDHRPAENDQWDPALPSPSEAQAADHPQLDHKDTSESRQAMAPGGRVWIPLIDGSSITIDEEKGTLH